MRLPTSLARFARTPYALWLGLGLVFALLGVGFDSPDEHFHTLEAAGRLLFGYGTKTWEWDEGHRSWAQPMILAAWLRPFVAMGLENRLWLDSLARVFNVLWMLPGIWAVARLAGSPRAAWWLAGAWPLAVWGTRHGLDAFCIAPMLVGFAVFLTTTRSLAAGLILGAACAFRFTAGVPIVAGVGIALALGRRSLSQCCLAGLGFLLALGAFSAFDWRAYAAIEGASHLPIWEFFRFRILQGNGSFHHSPWHELIVANLLLWVPPLSFLWIHRAFRKSGEPASRWAAWTWALSLAVFSIVQHKELRFILPIVPLALLATWRFPAPRAARVMAVANGLMLAVALLLYRDPHGALVRALDLASREPVERLWVAEIPGDFPAFYLRHAMRPQFISNLQARNICHRAETGVLLSQEKCGGCRLLDEVPLGLGYSLRQRISRTPAPRYVYRCGPVGLPTSRPRT